VVSSPQLILDLAQPEPPTLQNFVVGANGEAVAAVRALAHANLPHPGLLLWGAPGGGKSHLVQAAMGNVRAAGRSVIVCGAATEAPEPGDIAPSVLLVIDDVDGVDAPTQARLFTLVNALAAQGGQWLATAKLPPARLSLRDDLRTRLALGLVLEVVPLADADKPAALAAYARERGFALSDDVIMYLLAHARRDMKSLVATLAAIDRQSLAAKRNVTVPLLREWLQHDLGLSR
jgi:DnaA family protein